MSTSYHIPVMADKVLEFLAPTSSKTFLDGTIGGGGHTEKLLKHGAEVVAIDQDIEAIQFCREKLADYHNKLHLVEANFSQVGDTLRELNILLLDGALLDLGVSSHQLDTAERGFAIMKDGPLDMRMSRHITRTAADIINTASISELAHIFKVYGEEPRAFHVAQYIGSLRLKRMFKTTCELADAIALFIPRKCGRHPATRVFQALRIAVNDELNLLQRGLEVISTYLNQGGRFAIISFHSLEDRIVKHFFRDRSRKWISRPEWPEPRPNPDFMFHLLTSHPICASINDVASNPRARSAKLRVVERC